MVRLTFCQILEDPDTNVLHVGKVTLLAFWSPQISVRQTEITTAAPEGYIYHFAHEGTWAHSSCLTLGQREIDLTF